jgi:hypothetical protein
MIKDVCFNDPGALFSGIDVEICRSFSEGDSAYVQDCGGGWKEPLTRGYLKSIPILRVRTGMGIERNPNSPPSIRLASGAYE